MKTVLIYKDSHKSEINQKWLSRFRADGWKSEDPAQEPQKVSGDDIAELIELTETKDDLEALIKDAYGVDIDKRKGLGKLKAEALELVNSNEG